jgi:hypothetical protein
MSKLEHPKEIESDVLSVYEQIVDKYFDGIDKSIPQYHQSISNLQHEYLQSLRKLTNSAVEGTQKYATKAGIKSNLPAATLKLLRDTTEEWEKALEIQNKITLAAIDATKQNIKTWNENTSVFTNLNKDILQSWVSMLNPNQNK